MTDQPLSCFDFIEPGADPFLRLEEAVERILLSVQQPPAIEVIDLSSAHQRVLASDVVSPMNVPPHRNSAMDGYAVKGSDLGQREHWIVQGTVLAGQAPSSVLQSGHAFKITTGAPMPDGADTVVMKEVCQLNGETLIIPLAKQPTSGSNVRQAGEDIQEGRCLLRAGQRLSSVQIGLLASLGFAQITVYKPVKVAVFSTGDEVHAPGQILSPGGIYDTNRFTLLSSLRSLGCDVLDMGILPDDLPLLTDALAAAQHSATLVLTSGGVSVGEADYVKQAVSALGEIGFWQLAIRPGRPLAFGRLLSETSPADCLFAGLPGNPVASLVTLMLVIQPLIRRLQGEQDWQGLTLSAKAGEPMKSRLGRSDFHRGVLSFDRQGQAQVVTTGRQGSGILTSMHQGNCLIRLHDTQAQVNQGELVTVYPFSTWLPGWQSTHFIEGN
ncbi:molybdopterin molybdotransferase MoeA [Nitrincola alkalisediminis]|uniref:molybdopterin molybdotransferase MoeA n=1 Tax=Nitrincola alkalisediminis TaxID=1366656 RepID=UPI0018756A25|nr:gephyrin-like molybdotransferase Glp [Nitrincola alkalisediminis]